MPDFAALIAPLASFLAFLTSDFQEALERRPVLAELGGRTARRSRRTGPRSWPSGPRTRTPRPDPCSIAWAVPAQRLDPRLEHLLGAGLVRLGLAQPQLSDVRLRLRRQVGHGLVELAVVEVLEELAQCRLLRPDDLVTVERTRSGTATRAGTAPRRPLVPRRLHAGTATSRNGVSIAASDPMPGPWSASDSYVVDTVTSSPPRSGWGSSATRPSHRHDTLVTAASRPA